MAYYIDIIDTLSPETKLVLENASASGIVLKWNGGDTKDEMAIVASEFNFDMLTKTAEDAAFIEFFSGDEHRFKVLVKSDLDDSIIWEGYVLPDLYSEPYQNVCFFVSFTATDGLGRLKGKYLPDEYYSREKSLIAILCQCLKLTGVELDLYFNPAIENFTNKDWNTIYIDTADFLEKEKKQDAYKILETLLKDTLCVCYQADHRWYIEGINTRHLRRVTYKVYDIEGQFVNTVQYNRLLKQIKPLKTPFVSIIAPYNEITITHPKIEPSIPKLASKEVNDGWALVTGVKGRVFASEWVGRDYFQATAFNPDYNVSFYNKSYLLSAGYDVVNPQDDTRYISLRKKIYFSRGQKINISLGFKIIKPYAVEPPEVNFELWKNPFKYEIIFNDLVLFSNFGNIVSDNEVLIFEEAATAEIDIEHIVQVEGLFDIRIYGPTGAITATQIEGISITKCELSVIAFKEEEIYKDLINGDFTVDKDVELVYSDDKSGFSQGFRLQKLKEETTFFNALAVPILYSFVLDGNFYSVVQLQGANLIEENIFQVYYEEELITIYNVFYNFNNGEQMVVQTPFLVESGSFIVKKYAVDDVVESRASWVQWTDAIYKIENTAYAKTVANIYRRMFNTAHEKLDVTALNAVKFNDVVLFNYQYLKDFYVLNCSWNLDQNKTTLTLGRSIYKDASSTVPGDENVPPIVLAGEDVFITDTQTTATLTATAYDPDGYIASQQWTKVTGGFGDIIESPFDLATGLQNLTENFYTYRITVTDNDGATATDTVNVIRNIQYTPFLQGGVIQDDSQQSNPVIVSEYYLGIAPGIPDGAVVTFEGLLKSSVIVQGYVNGYDAYSGYSIKKNGAIIENADVFVGDIYLNLNYINTDEIVITITSQARQGTPNEGDFAQVNTELEFIEAVFTQGVGTIIGLPISESNGVLTQSS